MCGDNWRTIDINIADRSVPPDILRTLAQINVIYTWFYIFKMVIDIKSSIENNGIILQATPRETG